MTLQELATEEYNNLIDVFTKNNDYKVNQLISDISFEDLIKGDEDKRCKEFIFGVLDENIKSSIDAERAKHILITWLVGIRIGYELGISDFSSFSDLDNSRLWLLTALVHDIGY